MGSRRETGVTRVRTVAHALVVALVLGLLLSGPVPAVAAPAIDYPTWADVTAARASEAKAKAQIAAIQALLAKLKSDLEKAQADEIAKGEAYAEAQDAYDAQVISAQGRALVAYFEEVAGGCGDAKAASNWVTNEVLEALKDRGPDLSAFPLKPEALAGLIRAVQETGLNKARAREVFARMLEAGLGAKEAIEQLGFKVVADEGAIVEIVRRAIAGNPKAVADFKKGKVKAAEIMSELEIAPTRRLRGLGDRQRKALLARFDFDA